MEDKIAEFVESCVTRTLESVSGVTEILGKDLEASTAMWGIVTTSQGVIRPICYSICTIFFLIEFIKQIQKEDMVRWETIFKIFIKLVLAKACIDKGPELMGLLYSTAAQWITDYGSMAFDSATLGELGGELNKAVRDMGFWATIGFAITSIIPLIVLLACSVIVKVIAYGRLIEIYVLLAVMPVPFAMILDGEGHFNTTKKYVLNFAGVCLQGYLMVLACSLYQGMVSDLMDAGATGAFNLLMAMLLATIVMVLAITKCGQWGKQIINAM